MDDSLRCPECSADWSSGQTCEDAFHQMLSWEIEEPAVYGPAHHLMVLSYYLQHPHLYSPEGLEHSKGLLTDFVERGITPPQVRQRDRNTVNSGQRRFKITGTPDRHGSYTRPVVWTMTAPDVIAAGLERYVDSIDAWSRSILEALRVSNNL